MENVVRLNVPFRQNATADRQAALMDAFARHRRGPDDVFWMKENAEFLNILECTGARPEAGVLDLHREFYDALENRMGFFRNITVSCCLCVLIWRIWGWTGTRVRHWWTG